ncbi:MAG: RNA-directed DNA polymerase [Bacteroidetes bacterium]|nr:RNA-directed DNA polymerase [Bacteroidota bacterium]
MKHEKIINFVESNLEIIRSNINSREIIFGILQGPQHKFQRNAAVFLSITHAYDLCNFLQLSYSVLQNQINNPVYKQFEIKKKSGGMRSIEEPNDILKGIQKRLNYYLQAYYLWIKPAEVHGFIIRPQQYEHRYNIVENARAHIGKKHVLNLDIKDFFSSISVAQIFELFQSDYFRFNENMCVALTLLVTHQKHLPTGAPTSPVLSNFICLGLDRDLREFAEANQLTYTRYADDLTFSSDVHIPEDVVLDVMNILKKHAFDINPKKIRMSSSFRKQVVTGITVNDKVNVDRKLLKKVRAMLHDFAENGLKEATSKHFKISVDEDSIYCRVLSID